jgi:hypothetical protein
MRAPDDLTSDELATLARLWAVYPGAVLESPDKDPNRHDPLVDDGYIERIEIEEGVAYRLSYEHAQSLAQVVAELQAMAEMN